MIFRQAQPHERQELFAEGYKVWSKNRTFEQYCADNGSEDAFGTRYVVEVDNQIVSSLILLIMGSIEDKKVYGIGSVLTPQPYSGKGYATELIRCCLKLLEDQGAYIFLYSDIQPAFYEKFGFRILPSILQTKEKSVCMVKCGDDDWTELVRRWANHVPKYF